MVMLIGEVLLRLFLLGEVLLFFAIFSVNHALASEHYPIRNISNSPLDTIDKILQYIFSLLGTMDDKILQYLSSFPL